MLFFYFTKLFIMFAFYASYQSKIIILFSFIDLYFLLHVINLKLLMIVNDLYLSSLNVADKSDAVDQNCDPKQQIPSSPTHYKQPPTPDHPPPSSSQAERTIHERIRPLSQEYKRRSALLQLQAAQQLMIETGSSPSKLLPTLGTPGYDYDDTVTVVPRCPAPSSGSLSSSISCSDHSLSLSTDYVEEFVSDVPFAGLLKGSTHHKVQKGQAQEQQMVQQQQQQPPRARPPIATKPLVPERKFVKPPTTPTQQIAEVKLETNGNGEVENCTRKGDKSPAKSPAKSQGKSSSGKSPAKSPAKSPGSGQSIARNSLNLLSPFNAEEARKKISEIIENFGSGILNTNITPTHDIELDFEDLEVLPERRELAVRLRNAGLLHLERILFENGYDNYKFLVSAFWESL